MRLVSKHPRLRAQLALGRRCKAIACFNSRGAGANDGDFSAESMKNYVTGLPMCAKVLNACPVVSGIAYQLTLSARRVTKICVRAKLPHFWGYPHSRVYSGYKSS